MFLDLNYEIPETELDQREIISGLIGLGYDGVAWTQTFKGAITPNNVSKIKLVDNESISAEFSSFSQSPFLSTNVSVALKRGKLTQNRFSQMTRANFHINDASQLGVLNPSHIVFQSFDLISVIPHTEQIFQQVCESKNIDIITFDFALAQPEFLIRPLPVSKAIRNGIMFEICYSTIFADPQVRMNAISNIQILVSASRGKNIIFSSGALSAIDLRSPHDVINLGTIFGLTKEKVGECFSNCRSVVSRSEIRKTTYENTFQLIQIDNKKRKLELVEESESNVTEEKSDNVKNNTQKQTNDQQKNKTQVNQKQVNQNQKQINQNQKQVNQNQEQKQKQELNTKQKPPQKKQKIQ